VYKCARKILDRILSRILDAILWPTQQQATGSKYHDADVALLEVGRRLEYLPQRKEMKIVTESEEKRGKEGSGKEGQRAGGQASQANANIIYDTEHTHTHTHTCFQNIVFSVPLSRTFSLLILSLYVFIYTYITHTQTHTRSLFMSLTRLYVCARERGGASFSLSMCVCVIEKGGGEFECILQLLAS
jgi:hypothetical protein